jgi:hypothetical protein
MLLQRLEVKMQAQTRYRCQLQAEEHEVQAVVKRNPEALGDMYTRSLNRLIDISHKVEGAKSTERCLQLDLIKVSERIRLLQEKARTTEVQVTQTLHRYELWEWISNARSAPDK